MQDENFNAAINVVFEANNDDHNGNDVGWQQQVYKCLLQMLYKHTCIKVNLNTHTHIDLHRRNTIAFVNICIYSSCIHRQTRSFKHIEGI